MYRPHRQLLVVCQLQHCTIVFNVMDSERLQDVNDSTTYAYFTDGNHTASAYTNAITTDPCLVTDTPTSATPT